ncbi:MAG: sigma-70 family RNA polymerase sigma factor [Acidobacteriota bacterium]
MNFADVYARHGRDVFRFALYLSGNAAVAEEIAAETFARAWVARDQIRVGTVKAYLLAIARNLHRDTARRPAEATLDLGIDPRDPARDPEAAAHVKAELAAVLASLGELPELDRAALLMATVEEMPYDSIGAALGLSIPAVKVRVHRARVKLNAARSRKGYEP